MLEKLVFVIFIILLKVLIYKDIDIFTSDNGNFKDFIKSLIFQVMKSFFKNLAGKIRDKISLASSISLDYFIFFSKRK